MEHIYTVPRHEMDVFEHSNHRPLPLSGRVRVGAVSQILPLSPLGERGQKKRTIL